MTDALLPRLLLLAAGAVWQAARSRYYFHMLQLNSYRNERYAAWLSKNPSQRRLFAGLPVAAVTAVALTKGVTGMTTAALLLAAAAIYTVCAKKPEKKPFVITDRVKRQFGAAAGLLLGALLVVALVWRADAYWGAGALLLLLALPVPLALPPAANRLMAGRERRIADSFVQAAREKLLAQRDFTVIGVTGSYGKTSVKYILSELLCEQYNTLMTPESYNTTMGVVRTVNEKLRPQHQVFVCEMGARQVGDIKEICDIVQPTYGIITSVGIAHLETFRSTENIRKTKFELADSLPDTGLAFLNFDSAPIASAGYSRPHVAYGLTPGLDCYSDNITVDERGTSAALQGARAAAPVHKAARPPQRAQHHGGGGAGAAPWRRARRHRRGAAPFKAGAPPSGAQKQRRRHRHRRRLQRKPRGRGRGRARAGQPQRAAAHPCHPRHGGAWRKRICGKPGVWRSGRRPLRRCDRRGPREGRSL